MKPNYAMIKVKTSKEFVVVIKRICKFEMLKDFSAVHYYDSGRCFDVVLLTDDRLIIVRNPRGTTKAHAMEFKRDKWEVFTDPSAPNVAEFLRKYKEFEPLGEEWAG